MTETMLGKIEKIEFGKGGYQEAEFGLSITFSGQSWGIATFISGGWAGKRSESAKWTEEDRLKSMGQMCLKVNTLLDDAKVDCVSKLKGTPCEVVTANGRFHSFRILKEVL